MVGKFGSPQIGVFSSGDAEYDNPNLNKCPNCGALFGGDVCPICKTVCPEEMKAGNRIHETKKKAKKVKKWSGLIGILVTLAAIILICRLLPYADQNYSLFGAGQTKGSHTTFNRNSYGDVVSYEELYRNSNQYNGRKLKFEGMVLFTYNGDLSLAAVLESGSLMNYVCVSYRSGNVTEQLMFGDHITIYGKGNGMYNVDGFSFPHIDADLIERIDNSNENDTQSGENSTRTESFSSVDLGEMVELNDWQVTVKNYKFDKASSNGMTILYVDVKVRNMNSRPESFASHEIFDAESEIIINAIYDGKYEYYHKLKDRYFDYLFQPLESYSGTMEFAVPVEVKDSEKSLVIDVKITNRNENIVYTYKLR